MQTDFKIAQEHSPQGPNITEYDYNIQKANELLDKAGYPKGQDGKRFKIELLTRTGEAEEAAVADLIKDHLSRVGIEVVLKRVDFATMLDLETKYQFDFVLLKRWEETLWSYQLFHSSWIKPGVAFSNTMLYKNPEVDRLLDAWLAEPSEEKQITLLQQLEAILTSELPEIPIYDLVWLNVKTHTVPKPSPLFLSENMGFYSLTSATTALFKHTISSGLIFNRA